MWKHYRTEQSLLDLLNEEFNKNFAKTETEKVSLRYE